MQVSHGRVSLELHEHRGGEGVPLLFLHALRGSADDWLQPGAGVRRLAAELWRGPILALDFCGHGNSGWLRGGAYYPELLAGDADAVLAQVGPMAVAGAGIGAWVALLLSGARPDDVRGSLLAPGAGLKGGGALPDFDSEQILPSRDPEGGAGGWDPAVAALEDDVRPVEYSAAMAAAARRLVFVEDGRARPPWWQAARAAAGATAPTLEHALQQLSGDIG